MNRNNKMNHFFLEQMNDILLEISQIRNLDVDVI